MERKEERAEEKRGKGSERKRKGKENLICKKKIKA